jgi:hypothetical protein
MRDAKARGASLDGVKYGEAGIVFHGSAFSRTQRIPVGVKATPRRHSYERWDKHGILNSESAGRNIRVGPVKETSVVRDLGRDGRVERSQRVITLHTPRKEVRIETDRHPGKDFSLTVATKPRWKKGEPVGQHINKANRKARERTFTSKRGRRIA